MSNSVDWPPLPFIEEDDPQADVKKVLYQAQVDLVKAKAQAQLDEEKAERDKDTASDAADWANEYAQAQAVQNAYLEVAKGNLDRATAKANFVQGAAVAISGAYVAILGLTFASANGQPLPARGVIPTLFLGLAIVLAAAYSSFLTKLNDVQTLPSEGTLSDIQRQRRNSFIVWSRYPTLARRYLLQTSIISLGIGTLLLPVPYLSIQDITAIWLAAAGFGLTMIFLLVSAIQIKKT